MNQGRDYLNLLVTYAIALLLIILTLIGGGTL